MAEPAASSSGGDHAPKEEGLMQQPGGAVEMEDLSKAQPTPANPDTSISEPQTASEPTSIPVPAKDDAVTSETTNAAVPAAPESSEDAADPATKTTSKTAAPTATPEQDPLTIDPVDAEAAAAEGELAVEIMLLLPTGARHPFRIDERYLTKRNVTVTEKTEDGKLDPFSITVYTLKELILRDWRKEWEAPPREPTSIRLIHFGKLLEDRQALNHYQFSNYSRNVVHMTVKPQDIIDEEEAAKKVKESGRESARSGCCVIL